MKLKTYKNLLLALLFSSVLFAGCRNDGDLAPIIQSDLSVSMVIDNAKPIVGNTITFTITALNSGPLDATGIIVKDELPTGYTFVSANPTEGTWDAPNWTINSLANAKTATLTIVAKVNSTGIYGNTATISGTQPDLSQENNTTPKVPSKLTIPQANQVNSFIWNGLYDYYLWNNKISYFNNTKYQINDSLNVFLNKYNDPQNLFTGLLYQYDVVDKWSFLVEDVQVIDDWISGTSKTMGFDFMLAQIGSSNDLFGFVRYVLPDSPAQLAGLKRGDIFMTIDDQQMTIPNYESLLFSGKVSYKIGFATITDHLITMNDRTANLTAIEMQENPIHKDTIFIYNNQKIGYLVYNSFNSDFDIQLNNVIKKFKNTNIDQMILDLRYNGGGSVQSCIYLASMLYSTDKNKLFNKAQYNDGLQAYYIQQFGAAELNDNFTTTISKYGIYPETQINTLNLSKIYFIVSDNTASASEMLINGLRPYMDVKVIGTNTYGKYVASMTIQDWDVNGNVDTSHNYAMQPIVVKFANSQGVSDFVNGLTPDITAEEDYSNLKPFGDPNEDLLSVVLADISGTPLIAKTLKSAATGVRKVADSQDFKPFAKEMYINPINKKQ